VIHASYLLLSAKCAHGVLTPLPPPVADLIHARHGQPGWLGKLLTRDATLEALADQAAQLRVGLVERPSATFSQLGRDGVTPAYTTGVGGRLARLRDG